MFQLLTVPIDKDAWAASLESERAGAVVTFEGRVRNHNDGREVLSLEYEAFASLACKEGAQIVEEAITRFAILKAACAHRVGVLSVGDLAVWVGVSAEHRSEAFAACRYIIDEIKVRLPIWKKEHYTDGVSEWINCSHACGGAASDNEKHSSARTAKSGCAASAASPPDKRTDVLQQR